MQLKTTAPEFDAGTFGAEEALKAMVEYQVESLRFVGRRTAGKLEYLRSLCHYIEWQDMAEVQRSWFKEWLAATGFALASDFLPLPCSCTARHTEGGQSRQCLIPDRPSWQGRLGSLARRRVRPIVFHRQNRSPLTRVTSPNRDRRTGKLARRRNALMVHSTFGGQGVAITPIAPPRRMASLGALLRCRGGRSTQSIDLTAVFDLVAVRYDGGRRRRFSWRKCHKDTENVGAFSVSNLPSKRNPYKQDRTLSSGGFCHDGS